MAGALWGITTYSNPIRYANKLPHLRIFSERIRRQGLPLCIVELVTDGPFEVDDALADLVLRVRSDAVMWQRERLLNIGLAALPGECDRVVWVDADLLFENDDWVAETRARLEEFAVVQPFDTASYLPPGAIDPDAASATETRRGIAFTLSTHPDRPRALANYVEHGHTGFGWGFRRSIVARHGYYDGLVVGGADIVMAHAVYDDELFFAGRNYVSRRLPPRVLSHAAAWAAPVRAEVHASVGYTPGTVHHLWHGDMGRRRYVERLDLLRAADFDPAADIRVNDDGCWTWGSDKPALHRAVGDYLVGRREDG